MGYEPDAFIAYGLDLGSPEDRDLWESPLPGYFDEYWGFEHRLSDALGLPDPGNNPGFDHPDYADWREKRHARSSPLGLTVMDYGCLDGDSAQFIAIEESVVRCPDWGSIAFDPDLLVRMEHNSGWDENLERALDYLGLDVPVAAEWKLMVRYG